MSVCLRMDGGIGIGNGGGVRVMAHHVRSVENHSRESGRLVFRPPDSCSLAVENNH